MKKRTKALLTLVLVILAFNFVRNHAEELIEIAEGKLTRPQEHFVRIPSSTSVSGETDILYLQRLYAVYNESYFGNKLTKTPKIDMNETKFMASTMCNDDMSDCVISFNPKFIGAPRVADFTMLHEQCHIKTWNKDVQVIAEHEEQLDHGKVWRSCMLRLDAEGAFREIIIDHYREEM